MAENYSYQGYKKGTMARAYGRELSISTKQSIEIANFIRGMKLQDAINVLEKVIAEKQAVPFKKYNMDMGHKKGIGPGRYPKKSCKAILKMIKLAKANAQFKNLDTKSLVLTHISANKASRPWHFGRQRRRKMKRTHIEVVVTEGKIKKSKAKKPEQKPKEKKNASEKNN